MYLAGEFKHGPLALADAEVLVITMPKHVTYFWRLLLAEGLGHGHAPCADRRQ